eukprot:1503920-Rhodomonas_salina.1
MRSGSSGQVNEPSGWQVHHALNQYWAWLRERIPSRTQPSQHGAWLSARKPRYRYARRTLRQDGARPR